MMRRLFNFLQILTFLYSSVMPANGLAQTNILSITADLTLGSAFAPAQLKGMIIHSNEPFQFDFIIDRGDQEFADVDKQPEYTRLIKYFLASLAIPDTDQWVNLSPYEQDRIISDNFGLTEMGRDMLAQDYLLKQISSALTNPDSATGRIFWDSLYAAAYEAFGHTNIPTDTFNKIWIIPDRAVIYEKDNTVYILEHHLKVLTETDYLAQAAGNTAADAVQALSDEVMRTTLIPLIEKEINEGRHFALLRQVYSGMLLAAWYKRALKGSILSKVYGDQSKTDGISQDPANNQRIYEQYTASFKSGVFNFIREDIDRYSGELIPRKYFSGGMKNASQMFNDKKAEFTTQPPANIVIADDDLVTVDFVVSATEVSDAAAGTLANQSKYPQDVEVVELISKGIKAATWTQLEHKRGLSVFNRRLRRYMQFVKSSSLAGFEDVIPLFPEKLEAINDPEFHRYTLTEEGQEAIRRITDRIYGNEIEQDLPRHTDFLYVVPVPQDERGNPVLLEQSERGENPRSNKRLQIEIMSWGKDDLIVLYYSDRAVYYRLPESAEPDNIGSISSLITGLDDKFLVPEILRSPPSTDQEQTELVQNVPAQRNPAPAASETQAGFLSGLIAAVQKRTGFKAGREPQYGGIDFAQSNLDMQIRRDGNGVILPMNEQNLDNIRINGLVPLILDIQPAGNLPLFNQN